MPVAVMGFEWKLTFENLLAFGFEPTVFLAPVVSKTVTIVMMGNWDVIVLVVVFVLFAVLDCGEVSVAVALVVLVSMVVLFVVLDENVLVTVAVKLFVTSNGYATVAAVAVEGDFAVMVVVNAFAILN